MKPQKTLTVCNHCSDLDYRAPKLGVENRPAGFYGPGLLKNEFCGRQCILVSLQVPRAYSLRALGTGRRCCSARLSASTHGHVGLSEIVFGCVRRGLLVSMATYTVLIC